MQRPFGFTFGADGTLRGDPEEMCIVQEAQQFRNYGYTLRRIANELTLWGYRNRAGNPFNTTQVHRMLKRHARTAAF